MGQAWDGVVAPNSRNLSEFQGSMRSCDGTYSARRAGMRTVRSIRVLALSTWFVSSSASAAGVWFNSDPDTDLTGTIVDAMERNVELAAGRPIEFAVNIFSFTDPTIREKVLELAKANPNLTVNIVTDWSMLSPSSLHAPPYLEAAAEGNYTQACAMLGGSATTRAECVERLENLLGGEPVTNVHVRYKKDDPYTYDASLGRAVYDHAKTKGLDHHKGIVFVIDGVPVEMLTGSFNWSPTANDSNYENLMRFHRDVPAERELIRAFAAEQGAMFHNAAVTLSGDDARALKTWLMAKHKFAAGAGPNPGPAPQPTLLPDDAVFSLCPQPDVIPTLEELSEAVDGAIAVMGPTFADEPLNLNNASVARLKGALGVSTSTARKIFNERVANGGFADADDLRGRVPAAAALADEAFDGTEFGTSMVAINHASAADLQGLPSIGSVNANKIRTWIAAHGPMESLADLRAAGLSQGTVNKVGPHADLRYSEAFFSSKLLDCDRPGTGFAAVNASNTTSVRNASDDGVSVVAGSLPAPAVGLFRRARPGDRDAF